MILEYKKRSGLILVLIISFIFILDSCGKQSVDKNEAVKIAEGINFNAGINKWKMESIWNNRYNKKTWVIISTFIELQTEHGYSAIGKELIIDSENGKILENNDWYLQ